jgi:hypothetical protein
MDSQARHDRRNFQVIADLANDMIYIRPSFWITDCCRSLATYRASFLGDD